MYKVDFLKSVVKACGDVTEVDVYDMGSSANFSIVSIDQVRCIRTDFHGFFDDYYDNNYYKENVEELQTIFLKIDKISDNKDLLENTENPIFQFIYEKYSEEDVEQNFLSEIVETLTSKSASEDKKIQFNKEFYESGNTIVALHEQALQYLFIELGTGLEKLFEAVKWE